MTMMTEPFFFHAVKDSNSSREDKGLSTDESGRVQISILEINFDQLTHLFPFII